MTLNADENIHNIEQARKENEEARKAKAKSINSIFTHVAEQREEAREERRNAEPVNIESDPEAEKQFVLYLSLLIISVVLMGLGLVTIGRFIVEHFRG